MIEFDAFTKIDHHPAQPDLPLRAGEALRRGEACWIGEDGQVWRTDASRPRPLIDGLALGEYASGVPVTLATMARIEVADTFADLGTWRARRIAGVIEIGR